MLAFAVTTQFRGLHFFVVHRTMHPWKKPYKARNGLANGDVGAFLVRLFKPGLSINTLIPACKTELNCGMGVTREVDGSVSLGAFFAPQVACVARQQCLSSFSAYAALDWQQLSC